MPLPATTELADQLFRAGEARAAQHGLRFKPFAESRLRTMAENGANTILVAAKPKPAEVQEQYVRGATRVAMEAMATLVDEMTSARYRIDGYAIANQNFLGEQTLDWARSVLCPIWPIC